MIDEIEYEDITDFADLFDLKHDPELNVRANMDIGTYKININPIYDDDAKSLVHEFMHYDLEYKKGYSLSENSIEGYTLQYCRENPGIVKHLNCYLSKRLGR